MFIASYSKTFKHGIFHYYTYCMADDTQLFLFGCGLGDSAIIFQIATCFEKYVELYGDPKLGRVVISLGVGETSRLAWRGDWNLYWIASAKNGLRSVVSQHISQLLVEPNIVLCPSKRIDDLAVNAGYETLRLPFGVGDEFHPLNLKRDGLGYAGIYRDCAETDIVLKPFLNCDVFEWIAKEQKDALSLEDLNMWYNRKQVVFGLCMPLCSNWGILGNRIFETLASGTPFITNAPHPTKEVLGFNHRYISSSAEETVELVESMLDEYLIILREFKAYSLLVRTKHNYVIRLKTLFDFLREL